LAPSRQFHPAIIYPVAATTTAKPDDCARYLAFLRFPPRQPRPILEKYGFIFWSPDDMTVM